MSKETYFEMCEALNSEPIPEEVPVSPEDLYSETILAFDCYGMLSENWSSMGGYLGKNLADLLPIMDLNCVSNIEKEYVIDIVRFIDSIVTKDIAKRQKQASKK